MPASRLDLTLGAGLAFLRRDPRPDAELLTRFLDDRDETAFAVLLVRHTPAVRAACQAWLRSAADVDDAAQATFLVLVRRARSIRDRAALGRWLYGVAANVARRLKQQQTAAGPLPDDLPGREPAGDGDLRDLLAEEVARLPEKYRLPVQLCYWASLTTAEAARRLGWPKGTVLTRLAWARKRLQKTLARRGVSPAAFAVTAGTAAGAVSGEWVRVTARAARAVLAGESAAGAGVSGRTISLTEGVVHAMMWDRLKYVLVAALLAVGLVGFGIGQWVTAADRQGSAAKALPDEPGDRVTSTRPAAKGKEVAAPPEEPGGKEAVKAEERPGAAGRRREIVIRLPAGTYVKEVDVAPYGSGRLTWNYEEDRVTGLIEGSVMGVEFEIATEAEYTLSSNGSIYGIVTGFRVNHLRLPDGDQFGELKPYAGLYPLVEPLINEVTTDLPFSYRFRVQDDRLVISNYRILLSGPNPLGKLGGLTAGGGNEALAFLAYFQALGTAIEGTYTATDGKEKPAPGKRPLFMKPRVQGASKPER
jgi:RNA polymerase sigma factor (sigma-70 family)